MLPTLTTERLRLRPFALTDAAEVQRLAGDRRIADTTKTVPHPYLDGMAEAWIATHSKSASTNLAVEHEGRLVGAMSLATDAGSHQAELGYWIGEPYWGRGFATEAARALLAHALEALGLDRVHACHLSRNPASGRVLAKLGMKHEGRRVGHVKKWGLLEDLELYGVLRKDFTR